MSTTPFTPYILYDTLSERYKTWKEVSMQRLYFNTPTSQLCYIAVKQTDVDKIIANPQSTPVNTLAYEYIENVKKKSDEIIIAIDLDVSQNMLDLTNKNDYIQHLKNPASTEKSARLIRGFNINTSINLIYITYKIKDTRCIKAARMLQ